MRAQVFLSHSSRDADLAQEVHDELVEAGYAVFLDHHPDDGIRAGQRWESSLWRQLGRADAVVVLFTSHWLASPWCVAEAVVARRQGKMVTTLLALDLADGDASPHGSVRGASTGPDGPGVPHDAPSEEPVGPPPWLLDRQLGDLDALGVAEGVRSLANFLEDELGRKFPAPDNPYPGLSSHTAEYAGVFFGRDREIREVTELLEQRLTAETPGLLLILGASGAGKSSLMRAGVLPRLGDDGTWVAPPAIDAKDGMPALAECLASASGEDAEAVEAALDTADLDEAVRLVRRLCRGAVESDGVRGHLVLGVDQLEVVFRGSASQSARRMLAVVTCAANDPGTRLTVMGTLRSDSFDQFQGELAALLGSPGSDSRRPRDESPRKYQAYPLDPMDRRHLGEIIERPASRVGIRFEAGLVEKLIEDTGGPDALPLLATTLEKLFERGQADPDDLVIEFDEYESLYGDREFLGGVSGVAASITAKAEKILEQCGFDRNRNRADWRSLRATFLRLLELDDAGRPVARPMDRTTVPDAVAPVISRMVEERLMVTARRPVAGASATATGDRPDDEATEVTVSVAHEALLRRWHRLQEWIEESEMALVVLRQARDAADDWADHDEDESWRWSETRVVEAIRTVGPFVVGGSLTVSDRVRRFVGPVTADEVIDRLRHHDLVLLDRAKLGYRLDLLGDQRAGVGVDADGVPDIAWLPVGDGTLSDDWRVVRSRPDDSARAKDAISRLQGGSVPDPGSDVPDDVVQPPAGRAPTTFDIAKYPITWAQFSAFESAPDYAFDAWWDGREPSSPPARGHSTIDNHPATHLTWYAARAFTRWMTARTGGGWTIRLPTEAEWQLAATSGDDREYPWGGLEDPATVDRFANTFDSRLSNLSFLSATTTTVGAFPNGASPVGALDMSGNCWEWCEDHYDPDETPPEGLPRARVVRGGSWVIGSALCTTRYTGRLGPHLDRYFVGFRPVRSRTVESDRP